MMASRFVHKIRLVHRGTNRVAFNVIGEIGAGYVADRAIGEREAYRIMTGAPIPENADAVVMLEQTVEQAGGFTLRKPFSPGENISFKGEDAKEGELLIEAVHVIHPGTIALLARLVMRMWKWLNVLLWGFYRQGQNYCVSMNN